MTRRKLVFKPVPDMPGVHSAMLKPRSLAERGFLVVSRAASAVIGLYRLEFDQPRPTRVGSSLASCPCCGERLAITAYDDGSFGLEAADDGIPF
jgi:hypothetical protein